MSERNRPWWPGYSATSLRRRPVSVALLLATGLVGSPAYAQVRDRDPGVFLNQQRVIEDEVRAALNRELPTDQKLDFDYGAWFSFFTAISDDGLNSSRVYRQYDVRPWASASVDQGAHEFYGRLKLQFQDFNHGDQYYGRRENDSIGPNLDRGYYQFDLRKALLAYAHERVDWDLKVKAGRDFVEFGTGYALSTTMDQVLITGNVGDFELVGLLGKTYRADWKFDWVRPYGGSQERCFYGSQLSYNGLEGHTPFVYIFGTDDQRGRPPWSLLQGYDYDSHYIGFGSKGELVKNLRYGTEWVFEGGDTYGNRESLKRDSIQAWAFDANLEYLTRLPMQPRFSGEYMFASGDGDRWYTPSGSYGGNHRGKDTSFNGFGYRNTGLAFSPLLSNLHAWRLGGAFIPLEKIDLLRKLELGTDWFLYCKNHDHGAISDVTANRQSSYLGWEMDYYANWRITSDLSYTVRLGSFFPGSSFSDQTSRVFLLTGVTWSF